MDIVNIVIMLLIGVFGGFISGLVGVGGAIIIYPAILLLPRLFGAPAYSAYIASGLTSSQVFFSTLSGSLKARKKNRVLATISSLYGWRHDYREYVRCISSKFI